MGHERTPEPSLPAGLRIERFDPGSVRVVVSGNWRSSPAVPRAETLRQALLEPPAPRVVVWDCAGLVGWDSRFLALVVAARECCEERGVQFEAERLPDAVQRLLKLAFAVPDKKDARRSEASEPLLTRVGQGALAVGSEISAALTFLGDVVLAGARLVRGRARCRWQDVLLVMQQCGPAALGIVALINFLIGLILAFVGATGLAPFGATIYVADMVAIGTVREMGCIMTGIILAGRTGASFAAQLGTMKVNEEITALQTLGISPIEFLVMPRMVALMLMTPLLCVFADLISIAGGFLVSSAMLDVTAVEYLLRTVEAVDVASFVLGVAKGAFFGFLVALTGCLRGMQCGNNAAAVGQATTRAVVAGITSIIASDGIFAVLCHAMDW